MRGNQDVVRRQEAEVETVGSGPEIAGYMIRPLGLVMDGKEITSH